MDHLSRWRAAGYNHVPVVECLGITKRVLDGTNAAAELRQLFENLPVQDLHELFGILLLYHIPDRINLMAFLQCSPYAGLTEPPSNAQIGFLRDENVWVSPPDASRENLWNYLLFRWTIKYFERTMELMLRSLSAFEQIPEEMASELYLMVTVVAHHGTLLEVAAPRIIGMLQHEQYCRDLIEHNELSMLTKFLLSSSAVSDTIKAQVPLDYFFRVGSGLNLHIQALALRQEAVFTVAATSSTLLETWIRKQTAVQLRELANSMCYILVDLPVDVHYIAILTLTFMHASLNIEWDMQRPYLYELVIHVLLSVNKTGRQYSLNAMLASLICQRLSLAFPRRNVIEACFYAFTDVLQNVNRENALRHQIEENLRVALSTNGNRGSFLQLVSWQEEDAQTEWAYLFPLLSWPCSGPAPNLDSVTEQPVFRCWYFPGDEKGATAVGLETVLRQVAFNGLRNPFTNVPFTWVQFQETNKLNL